MSYALVEEAAWGGGAEQVATQAHHDASRRLAAQVAHGTPERDVTSPLATVPVDNPAANPTVTSTTNPAAMPGTQTTPSLANPVAAGGGGGGGGGSWCVASPSASTAALQVALDYACGQGGVDCSAIQSGGGCFNPNTVRDHASFAFNSYYQKNPVATSCDFGGTATITNTDPSKLISVPTQQHLNQCGHNFLTSLLVFHPCRFRVVPVFSLEVRFRFRANSNKF